MLFIFIMVNVLKFRTLYFILFRPKFCFLCIFLKILGEMANSVDPDQTAPSTLIRLLLQEQSDLGLHCLHMPFCQTLLVIKF